MRKQHFTPEQNERIKLPGGPAEDTGQLGGETLLALTPEKLILVLIFYCY